MAVLAAEALDADRLALFSIDHGLRREARDDVEFVARLAGRLGLPFASATLLLEQGASQELARDARYDALHRLALEHGAGALATAHTLDDQAETVLMRLGKKSGVAGLSGIGDGHYRGLPVLRPLLGVGRDALREVLRARGIGWCHDPSNDNPVYQRVAVRQAMPALAAAGVGAAAIAASATRLADADAALTQMLNERWVALVRPMRSLWLEWDLVNHRAQPREIRRRLMERAMRIVGGLEQPRLSVIEGVNARLMAGEGATGARCVVRVAGGVVRVIREARGVDVLCLPPGGSGVFDGRFACAAHGAHSVRFAAVGDVDCEPLHGVLPDAALTAPAVSVGDGPWLAVPFVSDWCASATQFFGIKPLWTGVGLQH